MLLRLAVTKERRALACRTLYQWMRTSWKSLRDSSRAVATMGATRRWMQAGMARGRQGNLWAAPERRPVLTLAQLLRLRKETMEKLAWLVLIHRRTVLVSYLQTWRGKLASWRLLRSFLPNALSNLTASKASKRNEAVRPMLRVWEVAGSALLHRMWLDRALKSAMAVFRHHTSRCKLLRRSFGRLRNKRRVALSKETLENWRLGIASAQTMQKLERLLSREKSSPQLPRCNTGDDGMAAPLSDAAAIASALLPGAGPRCSSRDEKLPFRVELPRTMGTAAVRP